MNYVNRIVTYISLGILLILILLYGIFSFSCDPMVDFINYDIKGHFPNGDIRTAPDNGSGNEDIIYDVILQPGEVFYLQVVGHTIRDFGEDAPYRILYFINRN